MDTTQQFDPVVFQRMLTEAVTAAVTEIQDKLNNIQELKGGTITSPQQPAGQNTDPNKTPEQLNNERMIKAIDDQIKALDDEEEKAGKETDLTGKDREEGNMKIGASMERRAKYEQERQELIKTRDKIEGPDKGVQDYIDYRKTDTEETRIQTLTKVADNRKQQEEIDGLGRSII